MAFFMDPGAMFLGCLGPSEQKFLVTLIETAAKSGYTRFVEPCAGTFAMANLAVQNGFKPEQIETSDVNMMSTVLGYAITGQSLEPLEIHAQGFSDEELLDPATALYAQLYLRTSKNAGNDYFYQILTDLRLRREEHIESINRQIEVIKNLLGGMSYRPLDMWEHLKEVLDDPHALVIANPPTYFSGYEKFYDTQGKMTWKEPPYELFDPETGHQQFYDLCMDAKALVICYQEKRVGEAVGYTIYARSGTRADLNAYITTNREEEATALANGKKIKRPAESKLQPLDCSMLPRDYVIREDSKVQIIPIKSAEAQYYRELWTHNFVGSSATFNRALLIDGYVAGVFGISKMAADSVFVWYVMKVPHKTYRLGRLCYMLAQNRDFVDTLLDNIEQEKVTKMRTAMLTRYPENKEVRGIMKLVNRVEDKKNGYKLTYEAELVEGRTEQQTLGFKYILGGFTTPTDADLQKVKFRAKQETENDVKAGAIRIASDIIFWNTHLLDGSWDLDGSHRLDVTRGYQLGVAIVAMVAFAHNEVTDVLKVRSAYDLRTGSDVRAAIRSEFEADFWNTVYLDGKLLLDGNTTLEYRGGNKRLEASVTHHMGIKREDSDVSVQVITKTRNYWFFDGSNMLNGKKNLNSIYRKEYIQ